MFASSQNLLKSIPCPSIRQNSKCKLLNCFFSHDLEQKNVGKRVAAVENTDNVRIKQPKLDKSVQHRPVKDQSSSETISLVEEKNDNKGGSADNPVEIEGREESGGKSSSNPIEIVDEPPIVSGQNRATTRVRPKKDLSRALPRQVQPYNPVPLPQRTTILKHIHKAFVDKKHPYPNWASVENEYRVAKSSSKVTYNSNVRILVKEIKEGKHQYQSAQQKKEAGDEQKAAINQGLVALIIPDDLLKKWGYVTGPVVPRDLDPKMTYPCARCGQEFEIGSKRQVNCRFHELKPMFKYDTQEGRKTKSYGCCSQSSEESQGCCLSTRHVFKLDDPPLLSGVVPFAPTPKTNTSSTLFAAGIDCEMGYTNFGIELIRVTIVDWDTRKIVLDRTVYPYGEVIDLNTRFSGVHSLKDGIDIEGKNYPTITFKEARDLIFKYISASTIIIGHGLENDLNAMRLVHTRVVDTALRYPTFRPMYRVSLKQLAFKYLSRTIQSGEHDSSEDAIAAMDIVLADIRRKLKK